MNLCSVVSLSLAVAIGCGCAHSELADTDRELRFWLRNMVVYHDYTDDEVAGVLGIQAHAVPDLLAKFGIDRTEQIDPSDEIVVLPYPGGRHPRIGFLDGAIDPHRGTKVSIFTPWDPASYVVVDLPEAIWWKRGADRELLYLAHTHIPTHWDKRGIPLERIDWTRGADGSLRFDRRLPNGITFGARVTPRSDRVDMELVMRNGSDEPIGGLDTQVCVLLKGAAGFEDQTNDNKVTFGGAVAVRSLDGGRHMVTQWQGGTVWNNAPCPCMHSNPRFPDLAPGAEARVRGTLYFHVGDGLRAEVLRRRAALEK